MTGQKQAIRLKRAFQLALQRSLYYACAMIRDRAIHAILIAIGVAFAGCGNEPNGNHQQNSTAESAADQSVRFESPEAVVARAKELLDAEPPQVAAFFDLFEWETPEHQTWRRYIESMVLPNVAINQASMGAFGEAMQKAVPFDQIRLDEGPVTFAVDGRAEAVFRDGDGTLQTLHLVRIDGDWRISGYTIEYNGDRVQERFRNLPIDQWNDMFDLGSDLPPVHAEYARRIRSGEFETLESARAAFHRALEETVRSRGQ